MRLAIVGSRLLEGNQEAKNLIETLLDYLQPSVLISGGARGIDQIAVSVARTKNIPVIEHLPRSDRWEDGYKPRNLKIAQDCDHLIRIASSNATSYGSGWTRDQAAKLGKPVEEYMVDDEAAK